MHAIAALYLGFTVGFGHRIVAAVDRRFSHRFAAAPAPAKVPRTGPQRVAHESSEFRRALVAWAVSCAVLGVLILLTGDFQRAEPLLGYLGIVTVVLAIWFFTGPVPVVLSRPARPDPGNSPQPAQEARKESAC